MPVDFKQNMATLAGIDLAHNLVEVSAEGKISKVTALGYLWRAIQSFLGIGKGFTDCKLDNVAAQLNTMIDSHFEEFKDLDSATQGSIADMLKKLSDKGITKHIEASGRLADIAGLVTQAAHFAEMNTVEQLRARHALQKASLGQSLESFAKNIIVNAFASAVANGHWEAAKNLARVLLKDGMPESRNLRQMLLIVALEGDDPELKRDILRQLGNKDLVTKSEDLGRVGPDSELDGDSGLGGLGDPLGVPGRRASLGKALMRAIDHHLERNGGSLGELALKVNMKDSQHGTCFNEAVYDALLADCPHLADHVFQQMPDNFRKARVIADVLFLDKEPAAKERMFSWVEGEGNKKAIAQEVLGIFRREGTELPEDNDDVQRLRRAAGETP